MTVPAFYNVSMRLAGVFAPLPTPFDDRDRIDVVRLRVLLSQWLASPLAGFVMLGTTGEAGLLDDAECDQVVATARAVVPADRTLIAGTGRESTQATIRAVKHAGQLGADAALVRTPSAFKSQMTDEALIRHYLAVADASPIPVLLYNFAASTGVHLSAAAAARLSNHPQIIGIKESGSDLTHLSDLVTMTTGGFKVLCGSASNFYPSLCAGVDGGILALASLLPDVCVRLFELTRTARHMEARDLQRALLPLARLISTGFGVPGLKAALTLAGNDVGLPRPPLMPLSEAARSTVQHALATFEGVTA